MGGGRGGGALRSRGGDRERPGTTKTGPLVGEERGLLGEK